MAWTLKKKSYCVFILNLFYADLVLKRILAKEKEELEATLKLEQGLPSFLEETAVEIRRRKSIIRHSSPKKPAISKSAIPQRRIPFGNITNVESSQKVNFIHYSSVLHSGPE